jgi:hypothetical protein
MTTTLQHANVDIYALDRHAKVPFAGKFGSSGDNADSFDSLRVA